MHDLDDARVLPQRARRLKTASALRLAQTTSRVQGGAVSAGWGSGLAAGVAASARGGAAAGGSATVATGRNSVNWSGVRSGNWTERNPALTIAATIAPCMTAEPLSRMKRWRACWRSATTDVSNMVTSSVSWT